MLSAVIPGHHAKAEAETSLVDIGADDYEGTMRYKEWDDHKPFMDANGNLVDKGIGFYSSNSYGGTAWASYNIQNMGYTNFKTGLTLDSQWLVGDYGVTAVGFYADDVLLYEKQLSKKDGLLKLNISLPKQVKNFYIVVKQVRGARGVQNVVLANPVFSGSGTYSTAGDLPVSLRTIGTFNTEGYYYPNEWSGDNPAFQNIAGDLVTDGIGFSTPGSYGGTSLAEYNIDQMGYNQFTAKVSLDSKWTKGDYGRTALGVYADDYLLYEKEFTVKTPVQSLKLTIPTGTKNLTLTVKQFKGAKGTQNLVLANPLLHKVSQTPKVVPKTVAFSTVGAIDTEGNVYNHAWSEQPFLYQNNQFATSGLGLSTSSYYGGTAFAEYDIQNMGFNSLKTKLSLDYDCLVGDYGSSSVYIYADGKRLYSSSLKRTDLKSLTLRFPSKTKRIKVMVLQKKGAKGTQDVLFGNAVFTNLPISLKLSSGQVTVVNRKKSNDTVTVNSITKDETVRVYNSQNTLIASGKSIGNLLSLKIKQLGTRKGTLYVTRTSPGKLESDKLSVSYKAE